MTPTLASVAANQNAIAEATSNDLTALLAENAAVQSVLTAALLRRRRAEREHESSNGAQSESYKPLTVDEAARLCGCTPAWIRRQALHNGAWAPFTHRLSRKRVLFDRDKLRAWLASRRA